MYDIVYTRADGSFVILKNGMPYHVPNEGEYAEEWKQVKEFADENPDKVKSEPSYEEQQKAREAQEQQNIPPEQLLTREVYKKLLDFSRRKGYDSIISARQASGPFAADKEYADKAYNDMWSTYFTIVPNVKSGEMSVEDAIAALPDPKWQDE